MPTKKKQYTLMEVCGTHTMTIARHGLRRLFPRGLRMLSGPGCPVCVTPTEDIDRAIKLCSLKGVTVTTFGDMLNVPGSISSLAQEKATGADVRIVYSPEDALELAVAEPSRYIVFLGVGFETTSPTVAATVIAARKRRVKNFLILPMFKTIPNALRAILAVKERAIDGFILPGHVSAIIGERPYAFLPEEYCVGGVITGFGPQDILKAVDMVLQQIDDHRPKIQIQYTAAVHPDGNPVALKLLSHVFTDTDSCWRGIGSIPDSGLTFARTLAAFDAARKFDLSVPPSRIPKGCRCGDILMGSLMPRQCPLFGKKCSPAHPFGPCMVSSEGACAAAYRYGTEA
jgi:hydrogenase expression/formation protein HypD